MIEQIVKNIREDYNCGEPQWHVDMCRACEEHSKYMAEKNTVTTSCPMYRNNWAEICAMLEVPENVSSDKLVAEWLETNVLFLYTYDMLAYGTFFKNAKVYITVRGRNV